VRSSEELRRFCCHIPKLVPRHLYDISHLRNLPVVARGKDFDKITGGKVQRRLLVTFHLLSCSETSQDRCAQYGYRQANGRGVSSAPSTRAAQSTRMKLTQFAVLEFQNRTNRLWLVVFFKLKCDKAHGL
jgi:hypothetical protein